MEISKILPLVTMRPYIQFHWIYEVTSEFAKDPLLSGSHVQLAINITEGTEVLTEINNQVK